MEFSQEQLAAVSHKDGPMMVLAGPGSGKTTVITHRIKRLLEQGVSPSGILVITFTKAAALEMKDRFQALEDGTQRKDAESGRVSFGTFHSVFYQILRLAYRLPAGNVIGEPEKRDFIRAFLAESGMEVEEEGEFITSLLHEISHVKEERLDPDFYYSGSCPEEWFRELYRAYEAMLSRTGKLDFDDMLVMCHELFVQRKDILAAWQRKYRYILVDEFQDISRLQYEIVKMLALPENNLFIVGDDDQSIYRFRGARPEIMLGFGKDYPDGKRVLLSANYRSTREIVRASLKLISHNRVRYEKELHPVRGAGRPVDLRVYDNPSKELEAVAAELRRYHQAGYGYEDMAVLFRTGSGSAYLAEKLMEYNVPFQMRDAVPGLYSHWIARDLFAYLAIGAGSRKRSDFFRIMNRPNRYLSRDAFELPEVSLEQVRSFYRDRDWMEERLADFEADLRTIGRLKPKAAVRYIRETVGYDAYLEEYAKFRRLDPEELSQTADQLEENAAGFDTADQWIRHAAMREEELRTRRREQKEGKKEGVTLSTMHSAKGLEYAVVFLIDANEGITPHRRAASPADLEEERRLFYVAMTRARERLHIRAVRERYHRRQEISRFAEECLEEDVKMQRRT